jgi:uncharacterized protein
MACYSNIPATLSSSNIIRSDDVKLLRIFKKPN